MTPRGHFLSERELGRWRVSSKKAFAKAPASPRRRNTRTDKRTLVAQPVDVDMTQEMLERARNAATESSIPNVEFREAFMEEIPVADDWADVVISNGVLNLTPDKQQTLGEMFRVLRPGGRLQIADILVSREVSASAKQKTRSLDRLNRRSPAGSRAPGDGRRCRIHPLRNHLEGRGLRRRPAGVERQSVWKRLGLTSGPASPDGIGHRI